MHTTMAGFPASLNRDRDPFAGSSHDIRRTVGRAWLAIAASGEKIRKALSVHHSQVSYRKQGAGALASAAIEVASLERAGICTDPLTDAVEAVKLAARGPVNLTDAIKAEAEADAAEEIAYANYSLGLPGSAEAWASALLRQAAASKRAAQAVLAGGASR